MTSSPPSTESILDQLRLRTSGAAFVTEIQAAVAANEIEVPLTRLSELGQILILTEPAPDPHLEHFDLRVVSMIRAGDREAALEAARDEWGGWVRQFLANHRCQ